MAREVEILSAGPGIPDLHRRFGAESRRNNPLAVGADRQSPNFTRVSTKGECFLTLVLPQGSRIPDADRLVQTARSDTQAVRAERNDLRRVFVSAEVEHFPAGRRLPNAHRLIFANRNQALAVGTECEAKDESVVSIKSLEALAGCCVPQDQTSVEAGRDELPAVRAECQRADVVVMFGNGVDIAAGCRVPDLNVSGPAPGREAPAVRAIRDADSLFDMAPEGPQHRDSVPPVPDDDSAVVPYRQVLTVRAERHSIGRSAVVVGAAWGFEGLLVARRPFPHLQLPHLVVRARRGQVLAVRVEYHAEDGIGVCGESRDHFPRPAVADRDGPVFERGGDPFAVAAEC